MFGGIFGGLKKAKSKLLATRFQYTFTVHNLNPWPASNRALAVGWQRGKKKRGATRSVYTSTAPGRLGAVVRFNEKIDFTASLYKSQTGSGATPNGAALGPFKKKCIIMAVLETDGRTQATAALGRIVIDLAEFASIDGQQTRTFQVACNKAVHAAVGDPQLTITIKCQWRKSGGPSGSNDNGEMIDDNNSMSTDTTGSRMTANLSSFLRFKHSVKGEQSNEEQDLQGFDPRASAAMTTIAEGADEIGDSPDRPAVSSPNTHLPATRSASTPPSVGMTSLRSQGASTRSMAEEGTFANGIHTPPMNGLGNGLRSTYSQPMESTGSSNLMSIRRPADVSPTLAAAAAANATASTASSVLVSHHSTAGPLGPVSSIAAPSTAEAELVVTAAMEICVYLARLRGGAKSTKGPDGPRKGAEFAPARRLARTITCLGASQGLPFGRQALSVISSTLSTLQADMAAPVFWWSNCVHLRGLLQGTPSARWAAETLVPELVKLERDVIFEHLLNTMWSNFLLPADTATSSSSASTAGATPPASASRPAAASTTSPTAPPLTKRAIQEAAIKRWFEGLDAVSCQLSTLSGGTVTSLRKQLLVQCFKRLDALLFYHLITPVGGGGHKLLQDYGSTEALWGKAGAEVPVLKDSSLPFTRGMLSFGSGMSVKMTVTRLQQWASGEGISAVEHLANGSPRTTEALVSVNNGVLFPLMRAAADLLMMPKELLTEQAIRRDVCQSLSMRSMIHILEHFQVDEYAHDVINPELLATLHEELAAAGPSRPPMSDLSAGYRPPSDDSVWSRVESGQESGIDYGAESEEELDELAAMSTFGGRPPTRFRLLHALWSQGANQRA